MRVAMLRVADHGPQLPQLLCQAMLLRSCTIYRYYKPSVHLLHSRRHTLTLHRRRAALCSRWPADRAPRPCRRRTRSPLVVLVEGILRHRALGNGKAAHPFLSSSVATWPDPECDLLVAFRSTRVVVPNTLSSNVLGYHPLRRT